MKTKTQKILTGLSALSALAALAPITGNDSWLSFLSFLSFMSFASVRTDERMKDNLNRAARNGFIAAIILIIGFVVVLGQNPSIPTLANYVQAMLIAMALVFAVSFTLFDKKGY